MCCMTDGDPWSVKQHETQLTIYVHYFVLFSGAHVGFTVTAPVDNTDPRIFQTVIYNSETGFNASTGIFVCRHSGLYLFTVTVIREPGINEADCFISVNGSEKLRVFANDNKAPNMGFPSASGTLVVHLSTGDEVYLTRCSGTYMLSVSSFSGILIQPDTE